MIYFSIHLPDNDIPQAGHRLCYKHLIDFQKKHNIHFISQVNALEQKFIKYFHKSFITSRFIFISNSSRLTNFLCHLWMPPRVAIRYDAEVAVAVQEIINEYQDYEVFIEYEQGAYILPLLSNKVRSTVVFHDVLSQYILRKILYSPKFSILRYLYLIDYLITLSWERKMIPYINKAIVFSGKDKQLLVDLGYAENSIEIEHPHIDHFFYNIKRNSFHPETLIFWGSLNRPENVDGILWFMNSIYPKIKEKVPGLKVIVLGANPGRQLRRLASPEIIIPGYVKDPTRYFERAAIGIAPLRYGAGVKIKVLEFMASRIFTICTSCAAEGIDYSEDQVQVVDNETGFAEAVISKIQELKKNQEINIEQSA